MYDRACLNHISRHGKSFTHACTRAQEQAFHENFIKKHGKMTKYVQHNAEPRPTNLFHSDLISVVFRLRLAERNSKNAGVSRFLFVGGT